MDSLTQAVLGAACGQALLGPRLGRQALVWGAVAGLVPDLDMAVIPVFGSLAEFRYHRSVTHSVFFAPVVAPLLGHLNWRRQERRAARAAAAASPRPSPHHRASRRDWILLWFVALLTHPLLDWFTTYGTQLLWPLSHRRFALDAVAIIDPLYTVPLAAALVLGLRREADPRAARRLAAAALVLTTGYLFYGLHLNRRAEAIALREAPGGAPHRVEAYPTLFQPWLRRAVARQGRTVSVGLLSLWSPGPIRWRSFEEADDPRLARARETEEGRLLEWFADGQTAARIGAAGRAVEIDDLRYGYGARPDEGIWGIRIPMDAEGRPSGSGRRFNRRPPAPQDVLSLLWRETFG